MIVVIKRLLSESAWSSCRWTARATVLARHERERFWFVCANKGKLYPNQNKRSQLALFHSLFFGLWVLPIGIIQKIGMPWFELVFYIQRRNAPNRITSTFYNLHFHVAKAKSQIIYIYIYSFDYGIREFRPRDETNTPWSMLLTNNQFISIKNKITTIAHAVQFKYTTLSK